MLGLVSLDRVAPRVETQRTTPTACLTLSRSEGVWLREALFFCFISFPKTSSPFSPHRGDRPEKRKSAFTSSNSSRNLDYFLNAFASPVQVANISVGRSSQTVQDVQCAL